MAYGNDKHWEERRKELNAWTYAGWRERYAMEEGNKTVVTDDRNHELWVYTYGSEKNYQDANGATYDATEGRWVG